MCGLLDHDKRRSPSPRRRGRVNRRSKQVWARLVSGSVTSGDPRLQTSTSAMTDRYGSAVRPPGWRHQSRQAAGRTRIGAAGLRSVPTLAAPMHPRDRFVPDQRCPDARGGLALGGTATRDQRSKFVRLIAQGRLHRHRPARSLPEPHAADVAGGDVPHGDCPPFRQGTVPWHR
jgi:hypothetical protein